MTNFRPVLDHNLPTKETDIEGSYLRRQDLRSLNLLNANVSEAVLIQCNLSGVNMKGANIKYTNFQFAKLEGTNLSWVKGSQFAYFKGATYNSETIFPSRFSPTKRGMIKVPVKLSNPPNPLATSRPKQSRF